MIPVPHPTVVINRPLDEVFNFVVDFGNVPAYMPTLVGSRQTSDGEIGLGTTGIEVLGRPFSGRELLWEITEFERDHLCVFSNYLDLPLWSGMDREVVFQFEEVAGGVRLTSWQRGQLHGPLRLLGRILTRLERMARQAMLIRIKETLEGRPLSSSGRGAG